MQQATIQVDGMNCGSCVRAIEGVLLTIGVQAEVNLQQGTVDVQFDETKVELENINELITNRGYKVVK